MVYIAGPTDPWVESRLPERQVTWLKKYFEALDSETDEGAKDWAGSWAEGGEFVQGHRVVKGLEALLNERHRVWKTWPGLYHVVKKIFVAPGNEDLNFLVVASYAMKRRDGSLLEQNTAANYYLVERDGTFKIQKLEIYADPRPLLEVVKTAY